MTFTGTGKQFRAACLGIFLLVSLSACGSGGESGSTQPVGGTGLPPFAQQAYLKASNTGSGDEFGASVALSGDTLVVGAMFEDSASTGVNRDQVDNSALNSGAVYVFTRTGEVWRQEAYLKASNTDAGDFFGVSVALFGDTLVVGAMFEGSAATGVNSSQVDNSASGSGAVYVFTRTGGVWNQEAYLKASNTDTGDLFGVSVALSGDTLVVGATGEDSVEVGVNGNQADNNAPDSGAVYVFTRIAGVWSQEAYLKASNTDLVDGFGESVALSGDTLVVGAAGEDSAATGVNGNQADNNIANSGAVYVFTRLGGVWSQEAYIKASNTDVADLFGHHVALFGDTLVVGAPDEDSNATGVNGNQINNIAFDSGAAYVFTRTGGIWKQEAYLKASNTDSGDLFGVSLALSGDTLIVGAQSDDSNSTGVNGNEADNSAVDSGAAYLFTRTGGVWSQQAYLKASNTGGAVPNLGTLQGDQFGSRVALFGNTLAVGAVPEDSAATGVNGNQADNSAFNSGGAYVFIAQ